jgi:hypothetical protein
MVNLANKLQGWTESVYRFGCAFIHLSNFHDYQQRNLMELITEEEKNAIVNHLRYYHGGPLTSNSSFDDLIPYLPNVFDKIASNLECYVKELVPRNIYSFG